MTDLVPGPPATMEPTEPIEPMGTTVPPPRTGGVVPAAQQQPTRADSHPEARPTEDCVRDSMALAEQKATSVPPPRTADVIPNAPHDNLAQDPCAETIAIAREREPVPPLPPRTDTVVPAAQPDASAAAARRARLVLHHAAEAGDPLICRMVRRFGASLVADAILAGSAPDLFPPHEASTDRNSLINRAHTLQIRCSRADPEADLAAGAAVGARYLVPADPGWPEQLDDLGDTVPLGLWLAGPAELRAGRARSVAIVGARSATGYGMHVAGELAVGLAERGWTVISGAARGIDGAAHRGALAARGPTAAVLACGIDLVYPLGHEALISAVATDGVVVSELPPGTTVSRFRFLDRNRLIAALAYGTVVVEAAARSGSLVTARLADEIGRPVLAVPGPVTSEASQGTHQLIRDGALLVTRAAEIIEHLGEFGSDLAEPEDERPSAAKRPRDDLDPLAARLLDALPLAGKGALETTEAALAAGVDPRAALAALGRLAVRGWADRGEHGWYARRVDG
jgi:DNA processing protein